MEAAAPCAGAAEDVYKRQVFDRSALAGASIIVSGGRIGYQIELAPEELIRLARADTADIICG